MHRVYRKCNTCDSLLCVNVRIRDIVVPPFPTISLLVHYNLVGSGGVRIKTSGIIN